jgi:hypothetical protein
MFKLTIGRVFEIAIDDLRSYYVKLSPLGAVHVGYDGRRWCIAADSRQPLKASSLA